MTHRVLDLMTTDVVTLPPDASVFEAAQRMRDDDIGDVIVTEKGRLCGIVTDRDLVVRGLAEQPDLETTRIGDLCSPDVVTVSPGDDLAKAVALMRERAVRRLPVTEAGRVVGVVSLGDLAMERDEQSALTDISAEPPNR
jgi:CBS domain-containing protein